jgi:hypothetical protein
LCLFVASLVACTRPGHVHRLQFLAVWLSGQRLEPAPHDAKELPQPGSWETSFISVSCGPGPLDARWLLANDMISTQSVYIHISGFKS